MASGFTLRVAINAIHKAGATDIILAVPTCHLESARMILEEIEAIYCLNIRTGFSFAVADAYEQWSDLDEQEVMRILQTFKDPN